MAVSSDVPVEPVASDTTRFDELVELLEGYRQHFRCSPDPERAAAWLRDHMHSGLLAGYVALPPAASSGPAIGMALVMRSPAVQALGTFWSVRDLYVDPAHRHRGVARALLDRISADARVDGAIRLALQTDDRDTPARRLYERYGFTRVEGFVHMMLDLRGEPLA